MLLLPAAMMQGVPYYMSATQFDAGEYSNANNLQVNEWCRLWSARFSAFCSLRSTMGGPGQVLVAGGADYTIIIVYYA
jgi:hypothetical protein